MTKQTLENECCITTAFYDDSTLLKKIPTAMVKGALGLYTEFAHWVSEGYQILQFDPYHSDSWPLEDCNIEPIVGLHKPVLFSDITRNPLVWDLEAEMKKIGVNPRNKEASLYKIHVKYSNHDLRRIQGLFSASRRTPQEVIEHALHIQSGVASALKYDYEFWINCQGTFNINDKISVAEYL